MNRHILDELHLDSRREDPLVLALDYDGTLVPIAPTPELAAPDVELLSLLSSVSRRPLTNVHIVSGRGREVLAEWLGSLPLALWAEHGALHRPSPDMPWRSCVELPEGWPRDFTALLQEWTDRTPGSRLETKSVSVAWHYRNVSPELAARRLRALRERLALARDLPPFTVLEGRKVFEVRPPGVTKAIVARYFHDTYRGRARILAIGDDRTDLELFAALPPASVTVAVGTPARHARCFLRDSAAVRSLLRAIASTS